MSSTSSLRLSCEMEKIVGASGCRHEAQVSHSLSRVPEARPGGADTLLAAATPPCMCPPPDQVDVRPASSRLRGHGRQIQAPRVVGGGPLARCTRLEQQVAVHKPGAVAEAHQLHDLGQLRGRTRGGVGALSVPLQPTPLGFEAKGAASPPGGPAAALSAACACCRSRSAAAVLSTHTHTRGGCTHQGDGVHDADKRGGRPHDGQGASCVESHRRLGRKEHTRRETVSKQARARVPGGGRGRTLFSVASHFSFSVCSTSSVLNAASGSGVAAFLVAAVAMLRRADKAAGWRDRPAATGAGDAATAAARAGRTLARTTTTGETEERAAMKLAKCEM